MKIKVLHIISSVSAGGIESLMVSVSRNIDRERFQMDYAALNPNNPIHKATLEALNSQVIFLANAGSSTSLLSKILWRFNAIFNYVKLLNSTNYDIIHCHNFTSFGLYVLLAKLKGIPAVIVHCHTASQTNPNKFNSAVRKLWNFINFDFLIDRKLGCSDRANIWLYGISAFKKGQTTTVYNGVDESVFFPSDGNTKNKIRHDMNLESGFHFVNIGRFCIAKNQLFLLDIFSELCKRRNDVLLNIVGFGSLEGEIREKVIKLKLIDRVRFFKYDTDIPMLLKAMDYAILPSLWEGFPIAALEAQFTNIPVFMSDTVTSEVDIGLVTYLPIDRGVNVWADKILKTLERGEDIKEISSIKKQSLEIKRTAEHFESIYSALIKRTF